ncbi:MAG: asparaginase [Gemmatimonadales bacterium]
MTQLLVNELRNGLVEMCHRISVAVVDHHGTVQLVRGDPEMTTYLRSAAKPFQVLPLLEHAGRGEIDLSDEEVALACASHNSEIAQVELVAKFLNRLGLREDMLACGPHVPLYRALGRYTGPNGTVPQLAPESRIASNCAGKHTAMLALAQLSGWELEGYEKPDHPVQRECLRSVAGWAGVAESSIGIGVDGCGVATFAMPLRSMAAAYSRLASDQGTAARRVIGAMTDHAHLVAGTRRLCTALMQRYPGSVVAKMGAGGVYLAGLIREGLGIALKCEDGSARANEVALIWILKELGLQPDPTVELHYFFEQHILNTRREIVGSYVVSEEGDTAY